MLALTLLPILLPLSASAASTQSESLTGPDWSPPAKDGLQHTTNAHLSYGERIELNRELETRRLRSGADAAFEDYIVPSGFEQGLGADLKKKLHLDVDPDGSLLAFGGSFKARFQSSASTYIPYFGHQAPRNFPVTFGAPRVQLGRTSVELLADESPVMDGHTVTLDRGALSERYVLDVGQLEQLYVFDDLPGSGELTLEVPVETDLIATASAGHLIFGNEYGHVSYSHAIAVDAKGRRVAAPTSWTGSSIRIRVPADFVASAILPLTIDPVVTTFTVNAGSEHHLLPDVAYDTANGVYMVSYEREFSGADHDIYSALFDSNGTYLAGSIVFIDLSDDDWRWASVANNRASTQFLVAAENRSGPTIEVWGRTREAESNVVSAQFQISANTGNERFPDVGGDPNGVFQSWYLVVYERESTVGVDHDILARRVSPNTGPQNGAVVITNTSAYDKFPSVSKSNGVGASSTRQWNITWQREFETDDWDIYAKTVNWTGLIPSLEITVNDDSFDSQLPCSSSPSDLIHGSRKWVTIYQSQLSTYRPLRGAMLVDSAFAQSWNITGYLDPFNFEDRSDPSVDSNGKTFTLCWSETINRNPSNQQIRVGSFHPVGTGNFVSELATTVSTGSGLAIQSELCARRSGGSAATDYGVVWRTGGGGQGDVLGAIYQAPVGYGDFIGDNYCGPAVTNSSGFSAKIHAFGSRHAGPEPLFLQAFDLPTNQAGYFLGSPTQGFSSPAISSGNLCLGGAVSRFNSFVFSSGTSGSFTKALDTENIPTSSGVPYTIVPGDTWNFQSWFRDGTTNNFTDGVQVTFL